MTKEEQDVAKLTCKFPDVTLKGIELSHSYVVQDQKGSYTAIDSISKDGAVMSVQDALHPQLSGFQFHPEFRTSEHRSHNIFESFDDIVLTHAERANEFGHGDSRNVDHVLEIQGALAHCGCQDIYGH